MITALIIEDEKNSREVLASLLAKYCPQVQVVDEAKTALEGIEKIKQHKPHVVFLDIQMPGGDAFQMLQVIENPLFHIIFVTAFDQYALKAIKFSALEYIVKPIHPNELVAAVKKLEQRLSEKKDNNCLLTLKENLIDGKPKKLALPTKDETWFVHPNEIIYLKGEDNYTHFIFKKAKGLLVCKTLSEYEEILEDYGFVRCHKGFLVNLAEVDKLLNSDGGCLLMSNQEEIPIARRRKQLLQDRLKEISNL